MGKKNKNKSKVGTPKTNLTSKVKKIQSGTARTPNSEKKIVAIKQGLKDGSFTDSSKKLSKKDKKKLVTPAENQGQGSSNINQGKKRKLANDNTIMAAVDIQSTSQGMPLSKRAKRRLKKQQANAGGHQDGGVENFIPLVTAAPAKSPNGTKKNKKDKKLKAKASSKKVLVPQAQDKKQKGSKTMQTVLRISDSEDSEDEEVVDENAQSDDSEVNEDSENESTVEEEDSENESSAAEEDSENEPAVKEDSESPEAESDDTDFDPNDDPAQVMKKLLEQSEESDTTDEDESDDSTTPINPLPKPKPTPKKPPPETSDSDESDDLLDNRNHKIAKLAVVKPKVAKVNKKLTPVPTNDLEDEDESNDDSDEQVNSQDLIEREAEEGGDTDDEDEEEESSMPPAKKPKQKTDDEFNKRIDNNENKVFISNLPPDTTEEKLREVLSSVDIKSIAIPKERDDTSRNRGFSFVTAANKNSYNKLLELSDSVEIDGQALYIRASFDRERGGRGGGGRGGRGQGNFRGGGGFRGGFRDRGGRGGGFRGSDRGGRGGGFRGSDRGGRGGGFRGGDRGGRGGGFRGGDRGGRGGGFRGGDRGGRGGGSRGSGGRGSFSGGRGVFNDKPKGSHVKFDD